MCTPSWDIVTTCEVPEAVSLIPDEATVTWYPLGGAGDGAVQVTVTAVSAVCRAVMPITAAPPI